MIYGTLTLKFGLSSYLGSIGCCFPKSWPLETQLQITKQSGMAWEKKHDSPIKQHDEQPHSKLPMFDKI